MMRRLYILFGIPIEPNHSFNRDCIGQALTERLTELIYLADVLYATTWHVPKGDIAEL